MVLTNSYDNLNAKNAFNMSEFTIPGEDENESHNLKGTSREDNFLWKNHRKFVCLF